LRKGDAVTVGGPAGAAAGGATPCRVSGENTDFFSRHAGRDTAWAEWLAWQLQQAGYGVELDVWDWAPGEDFVARMQAALESADRVLAVCTEAYFASVYGGAELRAAFVRQAKDVGRIVPVLVEPVTLPPLYAPLIRLDLTGLDEAAAAARLRARLAAGRPIVPPPFPRGFAAPSDRPGDRPGFAGALPAVWKIPPRNPRFTGRDGMLAEVRRRLHAGETTLTVQALYGLGGVGKTQLALEYAHRFAADYDLVWWIAAEQPVLIPEQLTALADRLGLPTGPTVADTAERLLAELRGRARWLLVLDNAERPQDVAASLPGETGHVLVTSRSPGWGALGGRLEVDVLARTETIALLRARIPALSEELADKLAAELGDLPLAAAQAAGYLEQTDLPPADYLRRFRARRASLLARGDVVGYAGRIDTTWALSLERLQAEDPAAVQLLELAAFLAPEPIPLSVVGDHADLLDEPLQATAADSDALTDTVGALVGYSLAPALVELGGTQPARSLGEGTLQRCQRAFGPDHPITLWAATGLTVALDRLGEAEPARSLGEDTLQRCRRVLGPDHPLTLYLTRNASIGRLVLGDEAVRTATIGLSEGPSTSDLAMPQSALIGPHGDTAASPGTWRGTASHSLPKGSLRPRPLDPQA
jgi:TIR domain-containing protein/tetratricopeptide repeat protein/NB-ARC domain-containing protein